jgi:hypothetical protein
MEEGIMSKIKVYKNDKYSDIWGIEGKTKEFKWVVSKEAPLDKFEYNPEMMTKVTESGLSMRAKALLFFIMFHRFGESRVGLYSNRGTARRIGWSIPTVTRAYEELIETNILYSSRILINGNIGYQYYINDYDEWDYPSNKLIPGNELIGIKDIV